MKATAQIYRPLNSSDLRQLSQIQPGRAELRLFLELAVIISMIFVHVSAVIPTWTLPLVLIVIASRQHALLVLMHESAHRRISKNIFWNDFLGELIAWNFFAFMHGYRRHHHAHHAIENLNTSLDPDWQRKRNAQWQFPMKKTDFVRMILRDILLLNTWDYVREAKDAKNNLVQTRSERHWMRARIIYSCALAIALITTGLWQIWLLYWLLPILTFLKAIFRIRSIADHFCLKNDHPFARTRTVLSKAWDRFLIAPCSVGVHGPHHIYPSIPYYNLRTAHAILMRDPEYRTHAPVTYGYHRALGECLSFARKELI